jgi:hypothetical protein
MVDVDPMRLLTEGERKRLVEAMMKGLEKKEWKHPIAVEVSGGYHRCAGCGGEVGEDVFVVIHRARQGDTIRVFDRMECMEHYQWPREGECTE